MGKMIKCKTCTKEISANTKSCPNCGAKNKKPIYKRPWIWLIAIFILIGVVGSAAEGNDSNTSSNSSTSAKLESSNDTTESNDSIEISDSTTAKNSEGIETSSNDTIESSSTGITSNNVSTEYKNALKKAQVYSDTMHMSKTGIYDQLTSEYGEGFPADAAQYAIDNVNADWNKNALEKAKVYQDSMAMSKNAIYDQLTSEYGEQFTESQAQYAIDNLK